MERERCPVCDRYLACDAPEDGLSLTESLCYRGARGFSENKHDTRRQRHCHRHAVNWRSRALAAEARIREAVEVLENDAGMPPVDAGVQPYMDWRYIQRRDALAILTRDPVPEPARKPEPLVVLEIPDARCWPADGNGACIYLGYWVDDNGTLHPACDFEGTAFKDNQVPPRVSHCPFGEGALRVTVEKVTP